MTGIVFLLMALGPSVTSVEVTQSPDSAISALWRALSREPGESADIGVLARVFHETGMVFGGSYPNGEPVFSAITATEFVDARRGKRATGFHECEIARQVWQFDRFATVLSVVESRTDKYAKRADFTGMNSIQLYRFEEGWRIVSLQYQLPEGGVIPQMDLARQATRGECLE